MEEKHQIRKAIKILLANKSQQEISLQSQVIINKLDAYISLYDTWFVYLAKNTEVQLDGFIQKLWKYNKQVFIPHMNQGGKMNVVAYTPEDERDTQLNRRGIREPKSMKFSKMYPEITLTPGAAFDSTNCRIGRGGGNYDEFFQENPQTYKIGICFPEQLLTDLPQKNHDEKLDEVITA